MRASLRSRLSYANVVATIALLLAMGGSAAAAGHYLINSSRQINPAVLSELRGRTGPRGATGATGAVGARGPEGERGSEGARGPEGEPGPRGLQGLQGLPGAGGIGYSTAAPGPQGVSETAHALASEELPAGHYVIAAETVLSSQSEAAGSIGFACDLDSGKLHGGPSTTLDSSVFYGALSKVSITPSYLWTVSPTLVGTLDTGAATEVWVQCETYDPVGPPELNTAGRSHIVATKTTENVIG